MTSRDSAVHLLDVNLLVALAWPQHVLIGPAQRWFDHVRAQGWASAFPLGLHPDDRHLVEVVAA